MASFTNSDVNPKQLEIRWTTGFTKGIPKLANQKPPRLLGAWKPPAFFRILLPMGNLWFPQAQNGFAWKSLGPLALAYYGIYICFASMPFVLLLNQNPQVIIWHFRLPEPPAL